jgi:hypothetical protein
MGLSVEGETHTHPFTADNICQPTKKELSYNGSNGGGHFDTQVLVGTQASVC